MPVTPSRLHGARTALALLTSAVSIAVGCSSHESGDAAPADVARGDAPSDWGIKAYIDGRLVSFGPSDLGADASAAPPAVDALPWSALPPDLESLGLAALPGAPPSARPVGPFGKGQAAQRGPGAALQDVPTLPGQDPDTSLASYALLQGAAAECRAAGSKKFLSAPPDRPWKAGTAQSNSSPGTPNYWFMFADTRVSCDRNLAWMEDSLCIAAKLADLAEAVAPVTWSNATAPGKPAPWVFPAQSEQDKFVARDLAIYTLANLTFTDLYRVDDGSGQLQVCTDLYAAAAANPATLLTNQVLRAATFSEFYGQNTDGCRSHFAA